MDLKSVSTKDLVEELSCRTDVVETVILEPMDVVIREQTGPCVMLIVID